MADNLSPFVEGFLNGVLRGALGASAFLVLLWAGRRLVGLWRRRRRGRDDD